MKKVFLLFTFCITFASFAQQGINYKAIIKDNSGNVVANQTIDVQFIILEDATNVYQETHTPTTDANGLIIVNIGEGSVDSGIYADIAWSSDDHFLNVQINTGSGFTDMGTTQFMAVPYALQAETAETAANVTGLEAINEGSGIGWRLKGRDPANYDNIGFDAVDLSSSSSESLVYGASGQRSIAMGRNTEASADYSIAVGLSAKALNDYSIAIGNFVTSSGLYSTAIGYSVKAESVRSTALGSKNIGGGNPTAWIETDPLLEIGNGINTSSNALTILKNGTITAPSFDIAEITDDKALITKEYADANLTASGLEAIIDNISTGYRIVGRDPNRYGDIGFNAVDFSFSNNSSATLGATGAYSLASGFKATASGASSNSLGSNTQALGNYSTAIGQLTEASGEYSTAMGNSTAASGETSTAMGYNTNAIGISSTAMGSETSASASYATAMGIETDASGVASTAMGYNTTASSHNTTALGSSTIASGNISIAMGFRSEASGNVSTAIGYDSAAESYIVTAIGRYNTGGGNATSWVATDPLFEIGNGTSDGNRSNALTILKNGKIGVDKSYGINAKLDIDHASTQTSPQINIRETAGTYARLNISNTASSDYWAIAGSLNGTTSTDRINFYHSDAGDLMTIFGNGNVSVSGVLTHSSDRRLKNNIETIPYGLDHVLQLQPKAYNWKAKPDQENQSLGLIAQDVQNVIKEIVHTADDENKTLSVSYTELIPVLIKAMQEQQDIINEQDSKLEDQENQINGLTAELEKNEETQELFNLRLEKMEALIKSNNQ